MTNQELTTTAEQLVQKIDKANPTARLALQPQFSRVLEHLTARGHSVPRYMRQLDAALMEEVVEARFDNMPV